jgi:diguanylate cyclase (GGDEF)-like protein
VQARMGLGAVDRAQESMNEARALCEERELGETMIKVHELQAELYAMRGEFAAAYAEHKLFFEAHQSYRNSELEAQARTRQAVYETTEARQEAEQFREQARRDPLTGLRNRRFVDEHLPQLVDSDPRLSAAIVDLDHFKRINDQLSHEVGDKVLVRVAHMLESGLMAVRPDGFVARMGGEEFLMVLPETPGHVAADLLDDIRQRIKTAGWDEVTFGLPVTISIGLADVGDAPSRTQPSLLSTADRNLYVAKHQGRDRVVWGNDRVVSGNERQPASRSYRDSATAA